MELMSANANSAYPDERSAGNCNSTETSSGNRISCQPVRRWALAWSLADCCSNVSTTVSKQTNFLIKVPDPATTRSGPPAVGEVEPITGQNQE